MDGHADSVTGLSKAALVWGVLGAMACGSMIPLEPSLLEEGFHLDIAQRLIRGDHLYQDIVAFTGPLPFEMLALLFRVFGEEILVGRAAVAMLHGGATAAVFALARSTRADGLAHVAGALAACTPILLFPLFSTYFYTTLAVSISAMACWAALAGLRDMRWAVVAGMLVACAALCKQTVGAILALGLLTSLVACAPSTSRWRAAIGLTIGGGIVTVATLAAFAATGGLGALVYSLVELPLSFQSSYSSPYMNFWPPGRFDDEIRGSQMFYLPYLYSILYGVWASPTWKVTLFTQVLYALPFIAIVATIVRRRSGPLHPAVWIHFAALLAMATNGFPRADWGHLVSVLPSAAIQLVLIAPVPAGPARLRGRTTSVLVGILILASAAAGGMLYRVSEAPSFGPRVPLRVVNDGHRTDALPHAIRYLREHTEPGDAIFVARSEPLIYFATDTRNPTPYGGVIPGMTDEQQRVILEALETTRYVVMSDIDQPVFTYYRDELPDVQKFLERHFQIPRDYFRRKSHWILVLERGPDRGATHSDLVDLASNGKPWIRNPDRSLSWGHVVDDVLATSQNRRLLPTVLGIRGGGIDFDLKIPDDAVFQAGLGYPQATGLQASYKHPRTSQMVLSIRTNGTDKTEDEFEKLASKWVLTRPSIVRRWVPFEVDLSEFAGREVTLRLELKPIRPFRGVELAWWGSPRIVIRPDTDDLP